MGSHETREAQPAMRRAQSRCSWTGLRTTVFSARERGLAGRGSACRTVRRTSHFERQDRPHAHNARESLAVPRECMASRASKTRLQPAG